MALLKVQSEKEKGGSRGFLGSILRISLVGVGKHKWTKSGNEVLISIGEGKNTSSLPSLLSDHTGQARSRHGSMHDLPSVFSPLSPPTTRGFRCVYSKPNQPDEFGPTPRRWCQKVEEINITKAEHRSKHGFTSKLSQNLTKGSDALPSNPTTFADGTSSSSPKIPSKPPPHLLPPIELRPPSPPRTVLKEASPTL